MSGTQLKLRGIDRVKRNNSEWMKRALSMVATMSISRNNFTIDDARFWCDCYNAPSHPNAWGALLNTLARQGRIRRVGYRPSTLPSTHGRIVSVWEGVR